MSRNKAALVAKNKLELSLKAEPPANTEDTQMTDATSEDRAGTGFETITVSQALDLPNGPRKRGRDNSSILNSEDAEAAARDEDKQTIEESRREVEALHLTAGGHLEDQKMGFNDDSVPKPSSQGHAGKAVSIMECEAEKNNLHQLHLSTDGRRTVQSARNLNEQGTPVPEGVSCLAADSTGAGNQENQGEDASTEGRKLALSYLLA
ncbi:hypothetical protein BC939DRAFT_464655 [Gamsiella multidivaricata]|uniref:uncharacterized protein n=1 Tax=Gamsiella multidivaricata TaxID=101098 RepID=UPI00221E9C92|nr:uncharacterized protein BC939DRAFT_464655 [Gamsiella multidivaricata]KAI7817867.1 hypothetical protein BC939DRAFT_464655 [Gamsiella multidivaricata]